MVSASDALPIGRKVSPLEVVKFYLAMRAKNAVSQSLQGFVDRLLKRTAEGTDPRVVFSKTPTRGRGARDQVAGMLRCLEVLRLIKMHGLSEREAMRRVRDHFGIAQYQIRRDLNRWERELNDDRKVLITYIHNLIALKYLKPAKKSDKVSAQTLSPTH